VREPIIAKPLYTPTFMVNTNQHIISNRFDIGAQLGELGATLPITAEQNNPASHWMAQALFVHRGQLCTCDIEYQRSMVAHGTIFSTTT
jgi:hypothetical protein